MGEGERSLIIWSFVSLVSWALILYYFFRDQLLIKYCLPKPLALGTALPCLFAYSLLLNAYYTFLKYVFTRKPVPGYEPSRYAKPLFDCSFVVVCSCWGYYEREGGFESIVLGLLLCLHVVPTFYVWWDFNDFAVGDCCMVILVEAAVYCFRGCGALFLVALTVVSVDLQLRKNAYQRKFLDRSSTLLVN